MFEHAIVPAHNNHQKKHLQPPEQTPYNHLTTTLQPPEQPPYNHLTTTRTNTLYCPCSQRVLAQVPGTVQVATSTSLLVQVPSLLVQVPCTVLAVTFYFATFYLYKSRTYRDNLSKP